MPNIRKKKDTTLTGHTQKIVHNYNLTLMFPIYILKFVHIFPESPIAKPTRRLSNIVLHPVPQTHIRGIPA